MKQCRTIGPCDKDFKEDQKPFTYAACKGTELLVERPRRLHPLQKNVAATAYWSYIHASVRVQACSGLYWNETSVRWAHEPINVSVSGPDEQLAASVPFASFIVRNVEDSEGLILDLSADLGHFKALFSSDPSKIKEELKFQVP
ncbi:hypothetical protein GQ457_02G015180 [Hibiscus cannabinus]